MQLWIPDASEREALGRHRHRGLWRKVDAEELGGVCRRRRPRTRRCGRAARRPYRARTARAVLAALRAARAVGVRGPEAHGLELRVAGGVREQPTEPTCRRGAARREPSLSGSARGILDRSLSSVRPDRSILLTGKGQRAPGTGPSPVRLEIASLPPLLDRAHAAELDPGRSRRRRARRSRSFAGRQRGQHGSDNSPSACRRLEEEVADLRRTGGRAPNTSPPPECVGGVAPRRTCRRSAGRSGARRRG